MEKYGGGVDWKSYDTTTKEGYNLTLFRITEKFGGKREKKGPILLLHGFTGDAYYWMVAPDPS